MSGKSHQSGRGDGVVGASPDSGLTFRTSTCGGRTSISAPARSLRRGDPAWTARRSWDPRRSASQHHLPRNRPSPGRGSPVSQATGTVHLDTRFDTLALATDVSSIRSRSTHPPAFPSLGSRGDLRGRPSPGSHGETAVASRSAASGPDRSLALDPTAEPVPSVCADASGNREAANVAPIRHELGDSVHRRARECRACFDVGVSHAAWLLRGNTRRLHSDTRPASPKGELHVGGRKRVMLGLGLSRSASKAVTLQVPARSSSRKASQISRTSAQEA